MGGSDDEVAGAAIGQDGATRIAWGTPMNLPDRTTSSPPSAASRLPILLLVAVSLALGWILWPFYGTIMWGAIIALLFRPVQGRLLSRLRGSRTAAALLTMLVVLVIVVLPFILVMATLTREATLLYQRVQSGELNPELFFRGLFAGLPEWMTALLGRFGLEDFGTLQLRLSALLARASQWIASQALNLGQNTFEFVASLCITLYLAFFLLRDGDSLARSMLKAIPLAPADKQELLEKFTTVVRATVKGNLVVAAVQGSLGGLAFWFLDIRGALLWAVLMAFLSLLPAVGAGLVWLPVAAYLLITGALWQGTALVAYGVLVIGLVDNALRPALVGKDTRMPDYVVMITTLGGMAVFGVNGFVLGPVIAAMFMAVWHIHVSGTGTAPP